jgi:hypothetical protein
MLNSILGILKWIWSLLRAKVKVEKSGEAAAKKQTESVKESMESEKEAKEKADAVEKPDIEDEDGGLNFDDVNASRR